MTKRLPQQLQLASRLDRATLDIVEQQLQAAIDSLRSERAKLDQPLELGKTDGSDLSREAYATYGAALKKGEENLKRWREGGEWPASVSQRVLQGSFRFIWNEALELAAQTIGGTKGILVRDLKE